MDRCPRGSIRIGKGLALRVLNWHGGQSTAAYAVGSTGYAGRCVPRTLVRRAALELDPTLTAMRRGTAGKYTKRDERHLTGVVAALLRRSS